jgi:hypothetical protein
MNKFSRFFTSILAFTLLLTFAVLPSTVAFSASADTTTFSGRGTVVQGKVLGIQVGPLADTGDVSPQGGALEASLLQYPVNGLPDATNGALTAEVLHASTVAQGNQSRTQATVASFNLNVAGQAISGEFLKAQAQAQCSKGRASVSGSSEIVNLVINGGTPVVVSGEANQVVNLPGGGVVIINEQTGTGATADRGDITVNALHIKIPGVPGTNTDTDIIIASAHADITCATPPSCPIDKDFITGGGYIIAPSGGKGTFGVTGGIKNSDFWGHLTYIDHGTNLRVKGTGVTAYVVTGPTSRHIEGTCEINGAPGTYMVDVADNGEPGRTDDFKITLSTGYTAGGKLAGGNIQLHTCKPQRKSGK